MEWPGEKQAWDILLDLDPKDIITKADVGFNSHNSTYKLICLDQDISISLTNRDITSTSRLGRFIVKELGEYSRLSILRYLIHAKNLPVSGQLVRPSDLPGGDIFLRGTHVLPLDKLAEYFDNNLNKFLSIGKRLGGFQLDYKDISLKLFPFPRVPIVIIVWKGDEEFSSRSSLLFDSSCVSHMETGIIWSTAMMTVETMLINTETYNRAIK
ncbi:MAG: DUF3786 domain-containing protein [Candidatus Brocadiaceae bacterium]|nr:DUF3786 domain-containing protein [Candidatus Brocadiaceae bacterium]